MIVIRDLSKRYENGDGTALEALRGFDLTIADHEFVSLVGPSGCGKTTVLKIVGGLLRPTTGSITIDGTAITGPGRDRAIVFQDVRLLPWATLIDNVAYGLRLRKVPKAERRRIAQRELDLVGLGAFANSRPSQTSGGMAQRVGLARALAVDPDTLLMDEPFAALDALTRQVLQNDLLTIWQETKKTVLFVTHSTEEAILLSDRIVVMARRPGRVLEILEVGIPRPRDDDVRTTERFKELSVRIWDLLRSEVVVQAKEAEQFAR